MTHTPAKVLICIGIPGILGCVGPLVDDTVTRVSGVVSDPSKVPELDPASELAVLIDAHDQVEREVTRRSAFAAGKRVWYWDFGPATSDTLPLYVIVQKDATGKATPLLEHPNIIDSVPGQPGYGPFWEVYYVPVTDAYAGEAIPSVSALQDAQAAGLVGAPEETGLFGDCPVVHPDVRLQVKGGLAEPERAYYRGISVPIFGFGTFSTAEDETVPVADVVQVRREGGEPLDENIRRVDMTGDGDTNDTNNLFETDADGHVTTPLWRVVLTAVPTGTKSIDDNQDEKVADFMDYTTLFAAGLDSDTLTPKAPNVVAFQATGPLVNCPIEPPP